MNKKIYSINKIIQNGNADSIYAGGICGYSDNSYVMGSVAINPEVQTNGKYDSISGYINGGYSDNNYYYDGTDESLAKMKNTEFFFKPVSQNGVLGWSSLKYGGDVWTKSQNSNYPFPVLDGVKNQENFYVDMNNW